MSQAELSGPDLVGVVADADAVGLPYVVIGGSSAFLERIEARNFRDDGAVAAAAVAAEEHLRVNSRHGIIDVMRGGMPPLDFGTVSGRADTIEWRGHEIRVASLSSVVGFKRLAGRPQDRLDLTELEAIHGELPLESIPGLDF
jgi:hypothetical protein